MVKTRLIAVLLLVAGALLGYFVYSTQASTSKYAFKLGLDLRGGSELIYKADTSKVALGEVGDAMASLRDVIERRGNLFESVWSDRTSGYHSNSEHWCRWYRASIGC